MSCEGSSVLSPGSGVGRVLFLTMQKETWGRGIGKTKKPFQRNLIPGTAKMAQWVKCLPYKHKDLSLNPQHPSKSWTRGTHLRSAGRSNRQIPGVCWPASLVSCRVLGSLKRHCPKNEGEGWRIGSVGKRLLPSLIEHNPWVL